MCLKMNCFFGINCKFFIEKFNQKNQILWQSGWFNNLILDVGLEMLRYRSIPGAQEYDTYDTAAARFLNIGTGSSSPTVSQTGLDSFLMSRENTFNGDGVTASKVSSDPLKYKLDGNVTFEVGSFSGETIAELGFSGDDNSNYFNRQLVTDSEGIATTITVQSDEGLKIYFTFEFYPWFGNAETYSHTGDFTYNDNVDETTTTENFTANFIKFFRFGCFSIEPSQSTNNYDAEVLLDDDSLTNINSFTGVDSNYTESFTNVSGGGPYLTYTLKDNPPGYTGYVERMRIRHTKYSSDMYTLFHYNILFDSPIYRREQDRLTIKWILGWGRYGS